MVSDISSYSVISTHNLDFQGMKTSKYIHLFDPTIFPKLSTAPRPRPRITYTLRLFMVEY